MSELKWNWVYYPYLDAPNKQEESALKAGYIKVVIKDEADKVIAEKDAVIAKLKKEILRQKRLRCYNLKMWCSAERFTNRGTTIPEEGRWWERHFYSVCRLWERLKG